MLESGNVLRKHMFEAFLLSHAGRRSLRMEIIFRGAARWLLVVALDERASVVLAHECYGGKKVVCTKVADEGPIQWDPDVPF